MSLIIQSIILGIVEGITEFLPISSTGHLIIVNRFINFQGEFAEMFDIVIQLGAILSVIVYFWNRIYPLGKGSAEYKKEIWTMWGKTMVAVLPALVIGAALEHKIKQYLFHPSVISAMLIVGGIFLIFIESRKRSSSITSISTLPCKTAFFIGLIQCLAMIPGTSRSAATIIGAMLLGTSRAIAVEFSFFLAIPTMIAASGYSILKHGAALNGPEWIALATGFVVSFFVAWGVVAFLMNFIRKHDFKVFGWYRIVLGCFIIALIAFHLFPSL
ncbi:MAG TPA: undecaprenyl-diphosphatase [Fibrobacteres bacterium]|jgi:undecaprenyl-diphosphatase|nr:undecaprenyl-diphosphatase [Fibrobacterota bacterium]